MKKKINYDYVPEYEDYSINPGCKLKKRVGYFYIFKGVFRGGAMGGAPP